MGVGLLLCSAMLQGLLADGKHSQRLSRLLRERAVQQRTLALVKGDLAQADAVSEAPEAEQPSCSLAGRRAVLHLHTAKGPITYSVGAAPSAIWRGQVLMRCGPAFGLDGLLTAGSQAQNRVVIDGLAARPPLWTQCRQLLGTSTGLPVDLAGSSALSFSACLDPQTDLVALRLLQEWPAAGAQRPQRLSSSLLIAPE